MKKMFFVLGLTACGVEIPDEPQPNCRPYSEDYLHTVLLCDGNIEDMFIACDTRKRRQDQFEGCIDDVDLMDLEPNCYIQDVCGESK